MEFYVYIICFGVGLLFTLLARRCLATFGWRT